MRETVPSDDSSRTIWYVAGAVGVLLVVWITGWFPIDFGSPETGRLLVDPGRPGGGTVDDGATYDLSHVPPQYEPEYVDVPPEGGDDSWGDDASTYADLEPARFEDDPRHDVPLPEVPAALPPELAGHITPRQFSDGGHTEHIATKPVAEMPARSDPTPLRTVELVEARRPAPVLDLRKIDELIRSGDVVTAHEQLSHIWWRHPAARPTIERRIEHTSRIIFFSADTHFIDPYVLRAGDRLSEIGNEYEVPWQYVVRLNGVDPRQLRPGDSLKVIRGPFNASVDLSSRTLTVRCRGYYVRHYPIAIGRDRFPLRGRYTITEKTVNPPYTTPNGQVIAGDDPSNPLGERWIGFGGRYGLHGTSDVNASGRTDTAVCVGMPNHRIAEVYDMLRVGAEIVVEE